MRRGEVWLVSLDPVRGSAGEGGLPRDSKALCEQIRTISRQRLERRLGALPPARLTEIRAALDRHLWFDVPA